MNDALLSALITNADVAKLSQENYGDEFKAMYDSKTAKLKELYEINKSTVDRNINDIRDRILKVLGAVITDSGSTFSVEYPNPLQHHVYFNFKLLIGEKRAATYFYVPWAELFGEVDYQYIDSGLEYWTGELNNIQRHED